ncbi:MAG: S-layer glycoprotein N-glycosyltransferase AglJ [Candidatus Syntropharchaeia archaeon]
MDVCILIPTLNEERTIGKLVREFRGLGFSEILVIDGKSTDKTVEIAEREGARVVIQKGRGKGDAVQQAFGIIQNEVVVMIDGDGTYLPSDVTKLLKAIEEGADHVIGNRFGDYRAGSFRKLNRIGNKMLNRIFSFGYGIQLQDILSGYRALKMDEAKKLELNKTGFEIEAEMTIESVKKGLKIVEVPVTYLPREGKTKLNPIRDGIKIALTMYSLVRTHNPLLYFGLIGALFMFIGLVSGIYIIWEWFKVPRVEHLPLTIFTTLMILSGIQFFIFALLSDFIISLQREIIREMRRK